MMRILKNENVGVYMLFAILSLSYFSVALQNIFALLFFLWCILYYKKDIFSINVKILFILSIPFLLSVVSFFYSQNISLATSILLRRSLLLILGFFILRLNITYKNFQKGFVILLFASVIASIITIVNGLLLYNHNGVFFHPNFTPYFTIIHHPYFAAYILMTFIIFMEEYRKCNFNSITKVFIIIILSLAIVLSTARLAQLFFVIYIIFKVFKAFGKENIKILIVSFIVVIICSVLFIKNINELSYKYRQDIDMEKSPRLIIWKNSMELIKRHESSIFMGIGIGDYQEQLDLIHRESMSKDYPKMGLIEYNPHNQYIEYIITNGWVGILFLFYVFGMIYLSLKSQHIGFIFFTFFLATFFFTECVLNRQIGVYYVGIFFPLLYKLSNNK